MYNEIHSIPYAIEIWYEQCLFQSIKYFKCVRGIQRGVCIYFFLKITLGVSVSAQIYVYIDIYKYKVFYSGRCTCENFTARYIYQS